MTEAKQAGGFFKRRFMRLPNHENRICEKLFTRLSDTARTFVHGERNIGEITALAAGIREILIRRDSSVAQPVCLCLEDRSTLLAALFASLSGGPRFILPHAFNRQVLEEVRDVIPFQRILTDATLEIPTGVQAIRVEDCLPGRQVLKPVRSPDETFLFLFTGGSTGKPRSWSKTPRNLFGEAFYLAEKLAIGADDLFLSTVPPQHIYGLLYSVLLPFVASARVLRRTCTFPREILGALQEEGATVLVSVPIHYRALRTGDLQRFSLRLALSSAAPLDHGDAAFFLNKTGLAINEIYGSTETGGMAIRAYGMNHGSWEPFVCLDWKILSERLCVRSDFVSPDLPLDAEGFYLTADRVAEAGENRFRFLGRADHIVKIAGKRVDLEEVREKIKRIPGVTDAYITTLSLNRARRLQIATLVATDLTAGEIRAAIRSMDEPYGLPQRIRVVKAIPVLPNGKIDRQRIDQLLAAPHLPK
jgi:acyl-coenzyme A synthetase/AMP-(fatty) acid ligase